MKNFILVNLNDKNQVKVTSINNQNLLQIQNNNLKQVLPQTLFIDNDNMNDYSNSSFSSVKEEEEEESFIDDDSNEAIKPKKRCRLTHLSAEEKLSRRKMKNRIAAQNARDRKKVRMDYLEQAVKELKEENKNLQNENKKLKEQTKLLTEENIKLKSIELAGKNVMKRKLSNNDEDCGSQKSAVFLNIVSRPKTQAHNLNQKNLMFLMMFWVMSLLKSKATNQEKSNKIAVLKRNEQQLTAKMRIKLLKLARLLHQKQRLKACLNAIAIPNSSSSSSNKSLQLFQKMNSSNNLNLKKMILLIILAMKKT